MYEIFYHHRVQNDIRKIYRYYRKQSVFAAKGFLLQLNHVEHRISANPEQFAIYQFDCRKCKLRKYPHVVVYRINEGFVTLFAVIHGRRKDLRWVSRLPN